MIIIIYVIQNWLWFTTENSTVCLPVKIWIIQKTHRTSCRSLIYTKHISLSTFWTFYLCHTLPTHRWWLQYISCDCPRESMLKVFSMLLCFRPSLCVFASLVSVNRLWIFPWLLCLYVSIIGKMQDGNMEINQTKGNQSLLFSPDSPRPSPDIFGPHLLTHIPVSTIKCENPQFDAI